MKKILTLTMNPCIDKNVHVDLVEPNRKLRCRSPRYEPGGGGINVSRAIRKLGGDSLAVYTAGGPFGRMLHHLLNEEEINTNEIPIKGWTRENVMVFENSGKNQYRLGFPGPSFQKSEWQACLDWISEGASDTEYMVLSGSLPEAVPSDFYAKALRRAKEAGIRVILDTTGKPLHLALEEGGLFLIKPNLGEFKKLSGSPMEEESEWHDFAKGLVNRQKSHVVIVSLGAAGAMVFREGGSHYLRAPTVTIRSRVGAGDSMVAGAVLSLARGKSVLEAARFGIASGAAAVMTRGTELCRKEDAERLYKEVAASDPVSHTT